MNPGVLFFRATIPGISVPPAPRAVERGPTMWKPAIVIITAFVLVAGVGGARLYTNAWAKPRLYTDNDSPFFRTYRPGMVISHFYLPRQPCTAGYSKSGGGEGPRDINAETNCIIRTDQEGQFVEAIHAELLHTLTAAHAVVDKEEDHSVGGYRCSYRSGKSTGTVAIEPLERLVAQGEGAPPQGMERVRLRLRVNEEPTKWWSLTPSAY